MAGGMAEDPGDRPVTCTHPPHRGRTERGRTGLACVRAELDRAPRCDTDRRPPWRRWPCWLVTLSAGTGAPSSRGALALPEGVAVPGSRAASLALALLWLCPLGMAFLRRQPLACVGRPGPGRRRCRSDTPRSGLPSVATGSPATVDAVHNRAPDSHRALSQSMKPSGEPGPSSGPGGPGWKRAAPGSAAFQTPNLQAP